MLREYYLLSKPGIVRGNAIVAVAGFLFASNGNIDLWLLIAMLVGSSLIMASACVFNNYLDKGIDAKMNRTKKRALVSGSIKDRDALIYGSIIGGIGFGVLLGYTNTLTALVGLVGFVDYIALYGYTKRTTVHSTLVGTIAGATPPVAGYTAVTGSLDTQALLLFLVLVFWQMAHFYAIGVLRLADYKKAGIPVLPAVKGVLATKVQMIIYSIIFTVTALAMWILGFVGYTYLVVMSMVSIMWIYKIYLGFKTNDDKKWAGKIFGFSLTVLMTFSILISLNSLLP